MGKSQVYLPDGEGNGTPLQYSCLENPTDEEPGRLQSMGWQRVGHHWSDLAVAAAATYQMEEERLLSQVYKFIDTFSIFQITVSDSFAGCFTTI